MLLSGQNPKFNAYVSRIEDDIKAGTRIYSDISWQDICAAKRTKLQNLETIETWDIVDPRGANFLALTTKIQLLELQIAASKVNPGNGSGQNDRQSANLADAGSAC